MFNNEIAALEKWLCDNTNFRKLENPAFDDRAGNQGFFIRASDGNTEIGEAQNGIYSIAQRRYDIFIQFIALPENFLERIILFYGCGGGSVVAINDDSRKVFNEANNTDLNDNNYKFIKITVRLSRYIRANNCDIC